MTGRDLIIYILENHLEEEPIFKNGKFIGFVTVGEVAVKLHVGEETVKAWYQLGVLKGIKVGDEIFILENIEHPHVGQQH